MKNFNSLFMKVSDLFAEKSTCSKIKVGAVIIRDNRIISSGYNGVPSKKIHCEYYFKKLWELDFNNQYTKFEDFLKSEIFLLLHKDFSNMHELHAEQNAILFAKQDLKDCELYTTLSPCTYCAKMIVAAGFKKVYYKTVYESGEGLKVLEENNIEAIKVGD